MLLAYMLYAFVFGFICWLIQAMISLFARSFVSFYGDESDRQHLAETKSTIEAIAVMFRIIRTPPAAVGTSIDPEIAAVERRTALLLAQTRLREAELSLARLGADTVAPAPPPPEGAVTVENEGDATALPQLVAAQVEPQVAAAESSQVEADDLHAPIQPDLGMEGLVPPSAEKAVAG